MYPAISLVEIGWSCDIMLATLAEAVQKIALQLHLIRSLTKQLT